MCIEKTKKNQAVAERILFFFLVVFTAEVTSFAKDSSSQVISVYPELTLVNCVGTHPGIGPLGALPGALNLPTIPVLNFPTLAPVPLDAIGVDLPMPDPGLGISGGGPAFGMVGFVNIPLQYPIDLIAELNDALQGTPLPCTIPQWEAGIRPNMEAEMNSARIQNRLNALANQAPWTSFQEEEPDYAWGVSLPDYISNWVDTILDIFATHIIIFGECPGFTIEFTCICIIIDFNPPPVPPDVEVLPAISYRRPGTIVEIPRGTEESIYTVDLIVELMHQIKLFATDTRLPYYVNIVTQQLLSRSSPFSVAVNAPAGTEINSPVTGNWDGAELAIDNILNDIVVSAQWGADPGREDATWNRFKSYIDPGYHVTSAKLYATPFRDLFIYPLQVKWPEEEDKNTNWITTVWLKGSPDDFFIGYNRLASALISGQASQMTEKMLLNPWLCAAESMSDGDTPDDMLGPLVQPVGRADPDPCLEKLNGAWYPFTNFTDARGRGQRTAVGAKKVIHESCIFDEDRFFDLNHERDKIEWIRGKGFADLGCADPEELVQYHEDWGDDINIEEPKPEEPPVVVLWNFVMGCPEEGDVVITVGDCGDITDGGDCKYDEHEGYYEVNDNPLF